MPNVTASCRTALFPGGAGVQNVVVQLYSAQGAFIVSATSDANGAAFLGSRAAATYEIRITPPTGGNPVAGTVQKIIVDNAADQAFDVVIETSGLPVAQDVNLCRCSGYFTTSHGVPAAGVAVHFKEELFPVLLKTGDTTKVVVPTEQVVKTDSKGFASVDLIRNQQYAVLVEGYDNVFRAVQVPDAASAPLPDVLFPTIERVEYKDGNTTLSPTSAPTITLSVPAEKSLKITTVFRSGYRYAGAAPGVVLDLPDNIFVTGALTGDTLVLKTKTQVNFQPGSVVLKVAASDSAKKGVPVYPESAANGSLTVNVQ